MIQSQQVKTFFTESVVLSEHRVAVDHVPFGEGQDVAVFMMAIEKGIGGERTPDLKGSVLRYDNPLAPVSESNWEAGA